MSEPASTQADQRPLANMLVQVAISDSPNLAAFGRTKAELDQAFVEICRMLFVAGATVAYAGDLRKFGYTEQLIDLASAYARSLAMADTPPIRWYVVPGVNGGDDPGQEAGNRAGMFVRCHGARNASTLTGTPESKSQALHALRQTLAEDCDALIALGGQLRESPPPGVWDEIKLATERQKHAFIITEFGGAAGSFLANHQPNEWLHAVDEASLLGIVRHLRQNLITIAKSRAKSPPSGQR
ncbi:MAG: hypothetical protein EAZ99_05770 [Alphaproteobacteria bacterium]|nr:MAG: hypothetical protein EAZ99_05770 [Alphaproteobacteria bacterium]